MWAFVGYRADCVRKESSGATGLYPHRRRVQAVRGDRQLATELRVDKSYQPQAIQWEKSIPDCGTGEGELLGPTDPERGRRCADIQLDSLDDTWTTDGQRLLLGESHAGRHESSTTPGEPEDGYLGGLLAVVGRRELVGREGRPVLVAVGALPQVEECGEEFLCGGGHRGCWRGGRGAGRKGPDLRSLVREDREASR